MKAVLSRDSHDCCADSAGCLPADVLSVRSPLVSGRDPDGRPYRLVCNDIYLNHVRIAAPAVWLPAVVESLFADGEHFMFTCGCGDPGCAWIFEGVHVQHRRERIDWLVPDPVQLPLDMPIADVEKPRRKRYLRFSIDPDQACQAVCASLEQNMRGLWALHGGDPSVPHYVGDDNLTPCMFNVRTLRWLVRRMDMRWVGPRSMA
jgi:hypothetical protein